MPNNFSLGIGDSSSFIRKNVIQINFNKTVNFLQKHLFIKFIFCRFVTSLRNKQKLRRWNNIN